MIRLGTKTQKTLGDIGAALDAVYGTPDAPPPSAPAPGMELPEWWPYAAAGVVLLFLGLVLVLAVK